jgi:superfamily II DNA or RNA helicase
VNQAPQLRPYQVEQIAGVKRQLQSVRSTIVVAPTGSGKTVSMAELSRLTVSGGLFEQPGKVLILVGRDELVRQTIAKLEAVGLRPDVEKAAQKASTLAKVVVASVQSLRAARLKRWPPSHFGLVIVDECFPAGTLVDGRPIESLRVGDLVRSYNHQTKRVELWPVRRLFCSRPAALVTVVLSDGRRITCTAGHPFFDGRDYTPAILLKPGDPIYGHVANDVANAAIDWTLSASERRQRHGLIADGETLNRSIATGMDAKLSGENETASRKWISVSLQNRSGAHGEQGSGGGRRNESWTYNSSSARREEASIARIAWVDRVEIHERRGEAGFGSLCPEDLVYNFEVEGNHNYFVDDVLVHNCHHSCAASYRAIIDHFDGAKVVGYTATPDRADGKALGEVFVTVAHEYGIRAAIDAGYLVPIIARRVVIDDVDLTGIKQRAGDFAQDQLSAIMNEASAVSSQVVPLLNLAGNRLTVAYGVDVAHAEALAAGLNSRRPGCARAVSGQTSDDQRASLLAAFGRGEFQFLCNCDLLVEGWDQPEVACVAVVRPTRSRGRFVQMAGRGLRPAPWTDKRDCLVLTFTDANTIGLIGPADCLAGKGEIADDVRAEIERLIGAAQLPIEAVMDQAIEEVGKRREALALSAVVNWRTQHIDPFVGDTRGQSLPVAAAARAKLAPSPEQLLVINKLTSNSNGHGGIADKLPPQFTRADAYELISRLQNRERAGLCSYRQAKVLAAAGVIDTSRLTAKRASELMLLARTSMGIDWSVLSKRIANQPECLLDQGQVA